MDNLLKFVDFHNNVEQSNIYFNVNRAYKKEDKKYKKSDVSFVDYFHVDVDLQGGGAPFEAQRKEILESFMSYVPKPSIIIDSGGGYQAFWKLTTSIEVSHDKRHSNIEDIEAYNNQIRTVLGADACQNIDRIMRLPFTRNFPNEKKRDMGRTESKSDLIYFEDTTYLIKDFAKSEIVSSNVSNTIDINFGNLQDISLDSLSLPKELKHLIINGDSGNRSEAVISVTTRLLSLLPKDTQYDTIASILLNKEFRVSDHVLDQTHPENYVKRQIDRALDYMYNENMGKLNELFCVVNYNGKTLVFKECEDDIFPGRKMIEKWTVPSFKDFYSNIIINTGRRNKKGEDDLRQLGHWWLGDPNRRTYDGVIFLPNKNIPGKFNLWQGFKYKPKQGDCNKYYDHILQNICNSNIKIYNWLIKWMARCIQYPDTVGQVAIVLRGKIGVGKGVFADILGELFGQHYIFTSQSSQLTGKFNAHLRDCILCFADEAFFAGDKQGEAVLKTIITSKTLPIEEKGVNIGPQPKNFIHLIIASNLEWTIPASAHERRFLVLDVSSEHLQDNEYFAALENQMINGGYSALLYDLLRIDLKGFEIEVRNPPKTKALFHQQLITMSDEKKWWYEKLMQGQICPSHLHWEDAVQQDLMINDYLKFAQISGVRYKKTSMPLMTFFKTILPAKTMPIIKSSLIANPDKQDKWYAQSNEAPETIKVQFLEFPDLNDCRQSFADFLEVQIEWPEIKEVERIDEIHQF